MTINIARFNVSIGKNKPENIIHTENSCPFCSPDTLTDIIETEDSMIFLRNKYNVIEDADQFVLVEADRCGIDKLREGKLYTHSSLDGEFFSRNVCIYDISKCF